ncbi:hypothetical protein EKH83_16210 [Arcticibacter tournemirensis]|uniref:Uncharacterized protein n=1 Tax=Arcticibacter tournemirensis TaxID=699437 RepID=A0A4Q0M629_9SPHI|nr:hypothetical protein [Arcticibacter tournemirensis]KAA8482565.1 hypothetical protein F1649_11340 [Arcticibacter tournemirensis]RXF68424.1 hypothetical protein EKH83_16210 [Arcticibacter tournemirensis]
MKIEDNCFSLLYSEPGDSTGKLKLFHLFSDINLWDTDGKGFIIAYGPGVEFASHEWLNDTINQQHIKNSYHIN